MFIRRFLVRKKPGHGPVKGMRFDLPTLTRLQGHYPGADAIWSSTLPVNYLFLWLGLLGHSSQTYTPRHTNIPRGTLGTAVVAVLVLDYTLQACGLPLFQSAPKPTTEKPVYVQMALVPKPTSSHALLRPAGPIEPQHHKRFINASKW